MTTENWYLKNKSRIMHEIRFAIPCYKKFIAQAYGRDMAKAVRSLFSSFHGASPGNCVGIVEEALSTHGLGRLLFSTGIVIGRI